LKYSIKLERRKDRDERGGGEEVEEEKSYGYLLITQRHICIIE